MTLISLSSFGLSILIRSNLGLDGFPVNLNIFSDLQVSLIGLSLVMLLQIPLLVCNHSVYMSSILSCDF